MSMYDKHLPSKKRQVLLCIGQIPVIVLFGNRNDRPNAGQRPQAAKPSP